MPAAPELFERDAEVARLLDTCRLASESNGAVIAVRGAPGIGKTALLDRAGRAAATDGLRVLNASGTELERELGFGVVRQLLEPLVLELSPAARDELFQGAAALAAPVVLPTQGGRADAEAVPAALHGLYWLTAGLASRSPLLLVVDDAHWADAASLRWLAYLARRLHGSPMSLILGYRPAEPGADMTLLEQVLSEADADVLDPRPLSEGASADWLARALGQTPSAAFASACRQVTGGNPFLLRELAIAIRDEARQPDDDAVEHVRRVAPATIARSVLTRLSRLGPDAVAAAETIAVLSSDARLDAVAALTDRPLEATAAAVDRLAEAGVLASGDTLVFAHPVLATAVYDQIPAARRGLGHAAAATFLEGRGAEPERVASHLLAAPPRGDQHVVDTLVAAAGAAAMRGAPESAVRLLGRALEEPPEDRSDVLIQLAQIEAAIRAPSAADHAREAIALAATPERRVHAALVAVDTMLHSGAFAGATEVLGLAEREAETLDARTLLDLRAMHMLVTLYHDLRAVTAPLQALRVSEMQGNEPAEQMLLAVLAVDLTVRGEPREAALDAARRALAHQDFDRPRWAWVPGFAARTLAVADEVGEARAVLDRLLASGRRRGAILSVAYASGLRAEVQLRSGHPAEAEADARLWLELSRDHDLWSVPLALAVLVEATLALAPPAAAAELIDDAGFDRNALRFADAPTNILLHARGRVMLALGQPLEAAADFEACGAFGERFGEINPAGVPWRSSLASALHALGRTDEASTLVEEELALARRYGAARAIGIALRTRALLQRGDAAVAALREAETVLASSPDRMEHARALILLGAALRRAGHRTEATETLGRGLDAARACGARQLATQARSELHAAGARPRRDRLSGPEALTASERRVADMATSGMTNRQIAQALFVTVKTVEMHLGRAYGKLTISRREELAAALAPE